MSGRFSPIGLDVGTRCVKAAQVAWRAGTARVTSAVCFDRAEPGAPAGAAEMERLASVLDRAGFAGRRCVIGVDRAVLMTAEIELPPEGSGAPREQIARLELARAHRREPAGFEVALWDVPAPPRSGGTHALAAACPHERAEEILDAAERAGLDAVALDHPGCALARFAAAGAGSDRVRAVLDLGAQRGRLTLARAGSVLFEREIDSCSVGALHARIAEQTGLEELAVGVLLSGEMLAGAEGARRGRPVLDRAARCVNDYADAAGRELRLSLDYLEHRFPPAPGERGLVEHVDLVGGGAACEALVARLAERAGVPLKVMRPADVLGTEEGALGWASRPGLSLAAGLALRGEDAA